MERTNARTLTPDAVGGAVNLTVVDASFIGLDKLMPAVALCTRRGGALVALVKPQFEVGRADVGKGGVVRDLEVRRRVVREVAQAALSWQGRVAGVVDSGVPGPKGNRETFLYLVHDERAAPDPDLEAWIAAAVT